MVDSVDKKTNLAHKSPISLQLTYSGLTYEDSEPIRSAIVPTMETWGVVTWAREDLQMWSPLITNPFSLRLSSQHHCPHLHYVPRLSFSSSSAPTTSL